MTNVASIGGIGGGSLTAQAPVLPAASQATSSASASASSQGPAISPRIVFDPLAGLITQYVNSAGKITGQTPTAAAVAYLRAGLTADGLNKPDPAAVHHHSSAA